jgi:hypothetical protein
LGVAAAAEGAGDGASSAAVEVPSSSTMLTRRVANRHARQLIASAAPVAAGARSARGKERSATGASISRKPAAAAVAASAAAAPAGTGLQAGVSGDDALMTVAEQRLCQQRLAQANSTITQLKARVAQQSANQSAMASSLEEIVVENDALRQALAQTAEQQQQQQRQRRQQRRPQPPPTSPAWPAPARSASVATTAWPEEQEPQVAAADAGPPLPPAQQHYSHVIGSAGDGGGMLLDDYEVSQLEHDEAVEAMDMEMSESRPQPTTTISI